MVCSYLAVPLPVDAVPGPLVAGAQQPALAQVHSEDALSVLQELKIFVRIIIYNKYTSSTTDLYWRLARSVPADPLLAASLHDEPLPLPTRALGQRGVTLACM